MACPPRGSTVMARPLQKGQVQVGQPVARTHDHYQHQQR